MKQKQIDKEKQEVINNMQEHTGLNSHKNFYSYKEAIEKISEHTPVGLLQQLAELKPVGIISFGEGVFYKGFRANTYNDIGREDYNNIVVEIGCFDEDIYENEYMAIAFHIGRDVRAGYTDYFLFEFDDVEMMLLGFDDEYWLSMGGEVYE